MKLQITPALLVNFYYLYLKFWWFWTFAVTWFKWAFTIVVSRTLFQTTTIPWLGITPFTGSPGRTTICPTIPIPATMDQIVSIIETLQITGINVFSFVWIVQLFIYELSEYVDKIVNLQFGYIFFHAVCDDEPEHLSFEQVLCRVAAQWPQQLGDDDHFDQSPQCPGSPELFCFISC